MPLHPGSCRHTREVAVLEPDLLTLQQVADRLQMSRWSVYQLIWSGRLPSVHLGRCHRVRARDFEDYLDRLGREVT
jgi:excisionase family DNA binding protein